MAGQHLCPALVAACTTGYMDVVQLLLQRGANIRFTSHVSNPCNKLYSSLVKHPRRLMALSYKYIDFTPSFALS